ARWQHARSASSRGTGAHVPVDVLVAWVEDRARFLPLEARLIENHLSHCADCRNDLDALRNGPMAPSDAGGQDETSHVIPLRRSHPSRARDTLLGVFAGVVATAAAIAVAWPFLRSHAREVLPSTSIPVPVSSTDHGTAPVPASAPDVVRRAASLAS